MAKVYKCDRCGAIFENEDKGHTKETDPCLDLCNNCYHEYLSWLDENKTKCDSDGKKFRKLIDADDLCNYANSMRRGITANDIMRFPSIEAVTKDEFVKIANKEREHMFKNTNGAPFDQTCKRCFAASMCNLSTALFGIEKEE